MKLDFKHKTVDSIIAILSANHGGIYEYLSPPAKLSYKTQLKIRCSKHGVFTQRLDHHANGSKCPRCSGSFYKTQDEFVAQVKAKYKDRFLYHKIDYKGSHQPVVLVCPLHGEVSRMATRWLTTNCKCEECFNRVVFDTATFIQKATKMFGNIYDYSRVRYQKAKLPVEVGCRVHGNFQTTPDQFFNRKCGCPRCGKHRQSNIELEWLGSLNNKSIIPQQHLKIMGKRYYVDGFDPTTNTVYEFNGDFFHGNPKFFDGNWMNRFLKKSFGDLYRKTLEKHKAILTAGFNLVTIWESDFIESRSKNYYINALSIEERYSHRLNHLKEWLLSDDDGDPSLFDGMIKTIGR